MSLPLLKRLFFAAKISSGVRKIKSFNCALPTSRRYCSANVGPNWSVDPCINFRDLTENFDAISLRLNRTENGAKGKEILATLKQCLDEYETANTTVGELERAKERNIADFNNAVASRDSKLRSQCIDTGKLIKSELKSALLRKRELYQILLNTALELPNRLHPSTPTTLAANGPSESTVYNNSDFQTQFFDGRKAQLELELLSNCCRHLERVGFQLVAPPDFLRSDVLSAGGLVAAETSLFTLLTKNELHRLKSDDQETYSGGERTRKGEDNDAYLLVGPSALSLSVYLMRTAVPESKTPVKLVCCGRQHLRFKSDALHAAAFQKASRVSVLVGTASSYELDVQFSKLQDTVLQFLGSLRIPVSSGKLSAGELAKHESARWVVTTSGLTDNFTVASLSYHYDYVSRRLMTEVKGSAVSGPTYLHTISGYVLDVSNCLNFL